MAKATTPHDLVITARDRRFGRGARMGRWWLNDDPIATAFYNALSVTFPKGEGFFVDSVRRFREGTSPRLTREINAFIKQEVLHTREHVAFNRHVTDQGYDVTLLDRDVDAALALTKGRPPIASLAATTALEHFTAMLAHELIANPRHLAGGEEQARACGCGTRPRRSNTRASPTTPGCTPRATGRASAAGGSSRSSC